MFQIFEKLNKLIVEWLQKPIKEYENRSPFNLRDLESVMQPGDILLVDGNQRVSSAIKYLTQSTWSHAAFYLGKNNKFSSKMISSLNKLILKIKDEYKINKKKLYINLKNL